MHRKLIFRGPVLGGQDVLPETFDPLIGKTLLTLIDMLGQIREHLDDQRRLGDVIRILIEPLFRLVAPPTPARYDQHSEADIYQDP